MIEGHATSAPKNPDADETTITTIVAALLWGVAWVIIDSGIISFRDLAEGLFWVKVRLKKAKKMVEISLTIRFRNFMPWFLPNAA